jgi:hypothetical protein
MVTFDPLVFWFLPIVFAVAFMFWVLCMFWQEEHRRHGPVVPFNNEHRPTPGNGRSSAALPTRYLVCDGVAVFGVASSSSVSSNRTAERRTIK